MASEHFDAVVIGSGFGGSVMAYRLAEAGRRVCLLERGKAYPPGAFPRTPREMRANFWDPSEGLHGLFDIWSFHGMEAVTAAGLGGGSLNYANVLVRKPERWFVTPRPDGRHEPWPLERKDLDPHYDAVERVIGIQTFPLGHADYRAARKVEAYRAAAAKLGAVWEPLPLAVTFQAPGASGPVPGQPFDVQGAENLHGRARQTCRLCGECDIGCNDGSKNTLDFTYLSRARRQGADLRTRCEVRDIRPLAGGGYEVGYVEHRPEAEGRRLDTRTLPLRRLTAARVVLAAGTLGSTFLLFRNRPHLPALSPRLGQRFSGNGDLLAFVVRARTAAGEPVALEPSRGPVITGAIIGHLDDPTRGFYLEDAGYPALASWLIEAANAPGVLRRGWRFLLLRLSALLSRSPVSRIGGEVAALLGDARCSTSMMPLLGMGMDVPEGTFGLRRVDGREYLTLDWPHRASARFFRELEATARRVAGAMGGELLRNPVQRLVGQLVTVHPLGGCAMGRDPAHGVVGPDCEVFGHPGLYVVDGSVMPGPVGPNPALTIAAIADRAATSMLS